MDINPYHSMRHQLQQIADRISGLSHLTPRKLTVYMIVNEPDWWLKTYIDERHSMDERLGNGVVAYHRLLEMYEAAMLQERTLAELSNYIAHHPYPDVLIKMSEPVHFPDEKKD